MVITLDNDKDNIFIVLSARVLSPQLKIISRVIEEENHEKLRLAGANSIISTDEMGGQHIAALMARPTLATFLNNLIHATSSGMRLDEVSANEARKLIGHTIEEIKMDALIVCICKFNGSTIYHASQQVRIDAGDVRLVLRTEQQ